MLMEPKMQKAGTKQFAETRYSLKAGSQGSGTAMPAQLVKGFEGSGRAAKAEHPDRFYSNKGNC